MAQDDEEAEASGVPWETVRAEFGFDDVGRRALRGGARDELLADYPHLREEDIEHSTADALHLLLLDSSTPRRSHRCRA